MDILDRELLHITVRTRQKEIIANFALMYDIHVRIGSLGWWDYLTRTHGLLKEWDKIMKRTDELFDANDRDIALLEETG
jgi:hypothetical protein